MGNVRATMRISGTGLSVELFARRTLLATLHALLFVSAWPTAAHDMPLSAEQPPYGGTVYIDPDWQTPDDPTIFLDSFYVGMDTFTWYDYRIDRWTNSSAYSYRLRYEYGIEITASVHTDLPQYQIAQYLDDYALALGQAPAKLLVDLGELQFVPEAPDARGARANGWTDPTHVVIYADDPRQELDNLLANGWLEEVLIHELGHAVFQQRQESPEWLAAQADDPCYLSDYARDYPYREDVAETLMPYLMLRLLPTRVSDVDTAKINRCIEARSDVLDQWFVEGAQADYLWTPWPQDKQQSLSRLTLEEPSEGLVHMGVGNLRGWALATAGIVQIDAYLDGEYLAEIPYGGSRGDVASAFPDVSGAGSSGFSMSLNYSGLCAGSHTLEVIAETVDGETIAQSVTFQSIGLDREFIPSNEIIDLDAATSAVAGHEIEVQNISIAGNYYNLLLRWRTAEQGFEIVAVTPLDSTSRDCQ